MKRGSRKSKGAHLLSIKLIFFCSMETNFLECPEQTGRRRRIHQVAVSPRRHLHPVRDLLGLAPGVDWGCGAGAAAADTGVWLHCCHYLPDHGDCPGVSVLWGRVHDSHFRSQFHHHVWQFELVRVHHGVCVHAEIRRHGVGFHGGKSPYALNETCCY